MKAFGRLYGFVNLLSLDVAIGSVISAMFFGWVFNVHILTWGLASLGISVWIIYTADHLIDALRSKFPAATERHRFHQQNFLILFIVFMIAVATDCFLITLIRRPVFQWGVSLAIIVIIYFLFQRYLKYLKEIFAALLYCLGVLLPALSLYTGAVNLQETMIILQFSINVLCNLILFSLLDLGRDRKDRQHSLATAIGARTTEFVLYGLFALHGVLLMIAYVFRYYSIALVVTFALMNLVLAVIFAFRNKLRSESFRLLGDAVFYLPILLLL